MKLAVVVPVYNEADCIRQFVEEWLPIVKQHSPARLILVDDGSQDETPLILDTLSLRCPGITVVHQTNQGHGAAIRNGYETALQAGAEWIFQTDSDRQFDPGDFERLWARRGEAALLLGTRTGRADPPLRKWLSRGNRLALGLLFGVRLRDPNSPFRLMSKEFLQAALRRIPARVFAPNVLLAVEAAKSGVRWREIPVAHRPRETGAVSIRGWRAAGLGVRCLREWLSYRFGERRDA